MMTGTEIAIIDTLITNTQIGLWLWRIEKDNHYVTTNAQKDLRVEVIDIRTGTLAVHLYVADKHIDMINLDDSDRAVELLNAIIPGRNDRLSAFYLDM